MGFFILFILGAQVGGGGAKIKKLFEKVKIHTVFQNNMQV